MEPQPLPPQGATLLIVDDEPMITDLFRQAMTKRQYQVKVAHSGPEALEIVDAPDAHINLVITDMTMPEMNGLLLAHELHARLPAVPVLIATGHDLDAEQMDLPPNVIEIIRKPYQMRVLAERIRQILTK